MGGACAADLVILCVWMYERDERVYLSVFVLVCVYVRVFVPVRRALP